MMRTLIMMIAVVIASAVVAQERAPVKWQYDERRCMAFNTADDGAPSVLLEAHGDRLTFRAIREGDMNVSAKATIAMIAKLVECDAIWARRNGEGAR